MIDKRQRILIMAGGTGGHIFPALAVAKKLQQQQFCHLAWLGSHQGLETKLVPQHKITLFTIKVAGLRGSGVKKWLSAPITLSLATWQAFRIIRRFKPNVILGMGGFASGPGGLVAYCLRITLVLHEQNAIAGLTNKILSLFANKVFSAFPKVDVLGKQASYVGNPLREEIVAIAPPCRRFANRKGAIRLLVLGGSRGALALNDLVPQALTQLSQMPIVWHQSGKLNYEKTKHCYCQYPMKAKVSPFISDIVSAYHWADLVICRAGAMTVSEIAAVGLPAIFIPFPFAVDNHQLYNAKFLVKAGAAKLLEQRDLTVDNLCYLIKSMNNRHTLLAMANKARACRITHATTDIVEVLLHG